MRATLFSDILEEDTDDTNPPQGDDGDQTTDAETEEDTDVVDVNDIQESTDSDVVETIDMSVALLRRQFVAVCAKIEADEENQASFEALSDLYSIASAHDGMSPALYAFANRDGSLDQVLLQSGQNIASAEGLMDTIKSLITKYKHWSSEGEASYADGAGFIHYVEEVHSTAVNVRIAVQKLAREAQVALKKATYDKDAATSFKSNNIIKVTDALRELNGFVIFGTGFGRMAAVKTPMSRGEFGEYTAELKKVGKDALAFFGLRINDHGALQRTAGQMVYRHHMVEGTYAEHGYTTQSLIAIFAALEKVVASGDLVWTSLIKLLKHNDDLLRQATDSVERRTIVRSNRLLYTIAHNYFDELYGECRGYLKHMTIVAKRIHDNFKVG